jgi:hypothetical protein
MQNTSVVGYDFINILPEPHGLGGQYINDPIESSIGERHGQEISMHFP